MKDLQENLLFAAKKKQPCILDIEKNALDLQMVLRF